MQLRSNWKEYQTDPIKKEIQNATFGRMKSKVPGILPNWNPFEESWEDLLGDWILIRTRINIKIWKTENWNENENRNETGEDTYAGALRAPRAGSPAFVLFSFSFWFSVFQTLFLYVYVLIFNRPVPFVEFVSSGSCSPKAMRRAMIVGTKQKKKRTFIFDFAAIMLFSG